MVSTLRPMILWFLVEGHLGMGDMVAAMGVGEEDFGAVGRPFDRPPPVCFAAHRQTISSG